MTAPTYESTLKTAEIDGVTLSYHEAGEGEPLILLHGSGLGVSAWSNFQHNLPVFGEQFRTIAPDLPGFGRSDLPELDEVYSVVAAKWIARLMDHLGIESAVFIGNSMGGAVAADLAALYPDRVRRMAIMGSGGLSVGIFGAEPSEGFGRMFEFLHSPSREGMVRWLETMVYDRGRITEELIEERMANAMAPGALQRTNAIFASMFDPKRRAAYVPLWTRAATFTTPTLMLWGRDDRMLPYDQAHFANRQLPDVELHTFSRCGHWVQIERKAEFERVAIEFLSRKSSA